MVITRGVKVALILAGFILFLCACDALGTAAEPPTAVPTLRPTITLFVPPPTPRPTATLEPVRMTVNSNVNCRSGPSTNYAILTSLQSGAVVDGLGRVSDNGWWYVQNPSDASAGCWIREDFAVVDGDGSRLPVLTPAAEPTATWAPVAPNPPVEPTAGCVVNDKITIINSTNDWITLNLSGPGDFHFRLASGKTVIEVCSGHYSYTGYGCGGDALNGEMKSGEKVEFYCE